MLSTLSIPGPAVFLTLRIPGAGTATRALPLLSIPWATLALIVLPRQGLGHVGDGRVNSQCS